VAKFFSIPIAALHIHKQFILKAKMRRSAVSTCAPPLAKLVDGIRN
jgi:hypothetical protein